ncbi:transposable element Tc1 transposase [Trichonephila clavata]|uniref:Transposable element Tc1 transposase n=1 Tax=Trichonephila clavata TaxID=2740835 RepID=A0A8X6KGH2_TRICU|nr:transposable element Tc1 transposase [Trichonephila clavata]
MMYPAVESCLPAEVLQAWDIHRLNKNVTEDLTLESEKVLENLMTFLHHEVEGEEHHLRKENPCSPKNKRINEEENPTEKQALLTNIPTEQEAHLKTIMIRLRRKGKEICVRAMLDDGSHSSYVEKDLVGVLKLCPSVLSRIRDESLLTDLASQGIKLTDVEKDTPPIRVLLGADIPGIEDVPGI